MLILMVLMGWKDIANYLKSGVRTVQRWETIGLPVRRPAPGKRSHVIADSDAIDLWIKDSAFWRSKDMSILKTIQRARELRSEARHERDNLHQNMTTLRNEMAALRARRKRH